MTALLRLFGQLARCSSGTATLEAAIVLPVAIALMAGGMDFGRAFWASATADKSMRDAARYLARVQPGAALCRWWFQNAHNLAVYGKLSATPGQELVSGWSTSNVTLVRPSATDCAALPVLPDPATPTIIELQASVPFTGLMLHAVGLSNAITMSVRHEERWIGE